MNISERLTNNEGKVRDIQIQIQQLQNRTQELLQELLRLDGEHRLLIDLEKEKV